MHRPDDAPTRVDKKLGDGVIDKRRGPDLGVKPLLPTPESSAEKTPREHGVDARILRSIWGFIGSPFNDNSPNDVVFTPFLSGVGGTVSGKWDLTEGNNTTFAAQLGSILAGLTYMNFHTVQFGAGEVRGQILVVPEPETYLLMLAGLGCIGAIARRRRAASIARL